MGSVRARTDSKASHLTKQVEGNLDLEWQPRKTWYQSEHHKINHTPYISNDHFGPNGVKNIFSSILLTLCIVVIRIQCSISFVFADDSESIQMPKNVETKELRRPTSMKL
jgi:hypothetical protein